MTDLEELFRPLIDDGAQHREPVDAIETRARDLKARRHGRQRVQYGFVASVVAVALIAAAVGIVHARGDGTPGVGPVATTGQSAREINPTVPPGWLTYDFGLARLSVPPDFTAVRTGCPPPAGPALEMLSSSDAENGPVCGHDPTVVIAPINAPAGSKPPGIAGRVNGIDYVSVPSHCGLQPLPPSTLPPAAPVCTSSLWVGALNVVISFEFAHGDNVADIAAIIDTLTYSTYARLLQQPFGPAPASWKTVALGGYVARVPRTWTVVRVTNYCGPVANTVYLEFAPIATSECPPPGVLVAPPRDSVHFVRDDDNLPSPPPFPPPGAIVVQHNGLRFARTPVVGGVGNQIHFTIDAPHGRLEVTLDLGLDPAVARGILGSLKMP